jgi:hypothetical protein
MIDKEDVHFIDMSQAFRYGPKSPTALLRDYTESYEATAVRKSYWVLLIFVLIGGLLGGVLGEILRVMAPHGTIQSIFATNFSPGISPFTIDLVLLKFTLGFEIKINLLSLLGMFLGIYLYKNV